MSAINSNPGLKSLLGSSECDITERERGLLELHRPVPVGVDVDPTDTLERVRGLSAERADFIEHRLAE